MDHKRHRSFIDMVSTFMYYIDFICQSKSTALCVIVLSTGDRNVYMVWSPKMSGSGTHVLVSRENAVI